MVLTLILLGIAWIAAVTFFRLNRIWLLFFLVGSIGCVFILIFAGQRLPVERFMEQAVALSVHQICNLAGVPTRIFEASPGSLLVLVVGQGAGWTVVQITIECSGLLETAAMLGIVLFYPGWSLSKRALYALVGTVAIFLANIVRMFFIVELLHYVGKGSLFVAHTIGGRAIFFVLVIIIYWFILTRPMLKDIGKKLVKEMDS